MSYTTEQIRRWGLGLLAAIGALTLLWALVAALTSSRDLSLTKGYGEIAEDSYYAEPAVTQSLTTSIAPFPQGRLYDESIAESIDEKIIRTANLDIVVNDVENNLQTLTSLAQTVEGYVQSASMYENQDGTHGGSLTMKVPEEQFDATLEDIRDIALVVEREHIYTDDVTEQYIDLAARLENKEAQEERYVEILDQADTVEDLLQIEEALARVRAEIESLQGQLDYLDSVTTYSTITIQLSEEPSISIQGKEFRPGTTAVNAAQALIALGQWLVTAIIWIFIIGIGAGLPLALIIWILIKLIRKIKR